ncbi:MAG: imidazole glycerol phosphate synthase subunit HisH [Candidatus Fibromonas sp.]|jgi:glutamine amidotransferase|nr:imidazole glycerol phosphate synthase subunit HisH [Candidatus Fibromonas sp.]
MIIVDYGAGNLTSVYNALKHLGIDSEISCEPEKIEKAGKIIFPGVGAAKAAMENLNKTGIGEAVKNAVKKGTPVLGICIGCQIILESSEEDGGVPCLGILKGKAVRFKNEPDLKIPHIGWNQVDFSREHPIFKGIPGGSNFYFVHSYYPSLDEGNVYGTSVYGSQKFPCLIGKDNLIAAQFHLEKSGDVGLKMLDNFAKSIQET